MTVQADDHMKLEDMTFGFIDNPKYAALIKVIADKCVANMTKKDQKNFRKNPLLAKHHFGYGLYIRNTYTKRFEDANIMLAFADDMSTDVLREIRSILMPEYVPPDEWS